MPNNSDYPLLDQIDFPHDLRQLSVEELPQLANELRQFTIETVAKTGGAFGVWSGCNRANRRLALFVQHTRRSFGMGCRPPVLPA